MAINLKQKPAPEPEQSAHDQAAEAIETQVTTTSTKGGEVINQNAEGDSEPIMTVPNIQYERIEVGMSFKMPVADYTMLEFSIRRSVPYDPTTVEADDVFDQTRGWVEAKLNAMIEEQQAE